LSALLGWEQVIGGGKPASPFLSADATRAVLLVKFLVRIIKNGGAGRRAATFFAVAALLGLPAAALRAFCLGNACEVQAQSPSDTPFCSLPEEVRGLVARGSYEGRSPDIVAVTGSTLVSGGDPFRGVESAPLWPSTSLIDTGRVPLVFVGTGVTSGAKIPVGTGLDDVSETISAMIDLRRPHPDVRSGEAIEGISSGEIPRLVLEVVWKGVDSDRLERNPDAWPRLKSLMRSGAATMGGVAGSLPLDPAATLATIGTGALPNRHGITGTALRMDRTGYSFTTEADGSSGEVVRAWTRGAPTSVVATLGDHLDEKLRQKPVVGLVGTDPADRGLIGRDWYPGGDRDPVVLLDPKASVGRQVDATRSLLSLEGFGKDSTTDLAGVVLSGTLSQLDSALPRLIRHAKDVSRGSATIVVTATGHSSTGDNGPVVDADAIGRRLERAVDAPEPVIEALVPGGVYLDQRVLARIKLSDDIVLSELSRMRSRTGDRLMSDVFPAIAITFGRYC
jgi:hypothetical protein